MKKSRLLWIIASIIMLTCILSVGCSKEDKLSSISFKDHDPSVAVEMPIGVFDYSAFTLVATYTSGATEEIALTEEMISEVDVFKFYQEGEHDVTVSYGGKTYVFKINVKRGTMGDIAFPEQNVFLYDGTAHTVEVDGNIPGNAVITYPGGNSFINAGTYNVVAVVTCEGYATEKITTTVTIQRAKYNMENVRFDPKEVVYDGNTHSVSISGDLPEGVSEPKYYIGDQETSGASNAGEYKVVAVFANTNPNYETIPDMETTLKITPAEYKLPNVNIAFYKEDGTVLDVAQKTYDGSSVSFDISDRSLLSKKVSVSFTVSDEEGTVISNSATETNMVNVGVYTVTAKFTLSDAQNYTPIDPLVRTFEIRKAEHDISDIYLDSDIVEYNGMEHKLTLELPKDHVFKPENIKIEYFLDGVLQENTENGVINAGEYTVRASFDVIDDNYEPVPAMESTLIIEKKVIDLSGFGFDENTILTYTGEHQTVEFNGLPKENLTHKSVLYKFEDGESEEGLESVEVTETIEVGSYRQIITVSIDSDSSNYILSNGKESITYTCDYEIVK